MYDVLSLLETWKGKPMQCTVEASLETAAFLYSVENGGGGGEMLVLPASGAMLVLL